MKAGFDTHAIQVRAPKKLDEKQRALMQAYAELEPGKLVVFLVRIVFLWSTFKYLHADTPGTIHGLTYQLGGKKTVISDPDGQVWLFHSRILMVL